MGIGSFCQLYAGIGVENGEDVTFIFRNLLTLECPSDFTGCTKESEKLSAAHSVYDTG